ncbi:MAG: hypothetical protein IKV52_00685 [Oscillospiraceae bacterium]|nr:hypothetical protein [Oscillospiraceae bacterium]
MEKKNTGILRSAMIGMAVGTALTAAGAMYVKENRTAQRAMDKAKESKRIITRAGENIIREIRE